MSDYLPNEVMMEFLARLPVRTLLQIRCVCKSWCSLISSENFSTFCLNRTTHLNNINNTHLLLIRHYTGYQKQVRFSLYLDDEVLTEYHLNLESHPVPTIDAYFTVVGSCNGLVCLTDSIRSTDLLYLWNPTIRKFVVLPEPRITFCSHRQIERALGYGFDSRTNDYKVVRIAYVSGGPEVDIYSLKEGGWRNISHVGHIPKISCDSSNAFLNGAIHWICGGGEHPFISSFNLRSEVFSEMKLPMCLTVHTLSVAVFQDSLFVLQRDCRHGKVSIWMMKQYGVAESWANLYSLDFSMSDSANILGLKRSGEVLLTKNGKLFSVDMKTQKLKYLGMRGHDSENTYTAYTYTESLVLIDKANGGFGEQARSSQIAANKNGVGGTKKILSSKKQ